MLRFPLVAFIVACATPAFSQDAVINGRFEKFSAAENLWDGIDGQNLLAGNARGAYAVMENGRIGDLPMASTVHFGDMNGDKLPDITSCDARGYMRVYFNSGTPTEPKFTHAEMIPIFTPWAAKISMFDWNKRGVPDVVMGNYAGDIMMVDNLGNSKAPVIQQPDSYAKVKISIGEKPWGNLFAPCSYDWNKDGKPDLLIGEGSYSANAIFVLLNQSSASKPKFVDSERYYLCYGDGREQLVPTVVDYNADGEPDVLVGDRLGTVGAYVNPGNWKPQTEVPLYEMLTFGSAKNVGTGVAPHACDYNGDGLFDLLLGKANGHIAVSLNIGEKGKPKFGPATDIKGVNLWAKDQRAPANWTIDYGFNRGNLYAYTSVQEAASPGGGKILKCGFHPTPNKVIRMVPLIEEGRDATDFFRYSWDEWHSVHAEWAADGRTTNAFTIRQNLAPLKVGSAYTLSFKVRGGGIREGQATVAYLGANENTPTKFQANVGGRGVKAIKDETHEQLSESEKFGSTVPWRTVEKTFVVRFRNKAIKKLDVTTLAVLEFKFELEQYLGFCEIADVSLVAKPGAN